MVVAHDSARQPILWVDPGAWAKLMMYVTECPVEVNGFGYLQVIEPTRDLLLASPDDIFITHQVVTAGSAEAHRDTVALALDRAAQAGRSREMRFQWHSHVDMGAYHSLVDMDAIDGYGEAGSQWMVSMVLNRRGEHATRMDVYTPFRMGMEIPVQIRRPDNPALRAACRADLERYVRRMVYVQDPDSDDPQASQPVTIGLFDRPPARLKIPAIRPVTERV